MVWCGVVWCGVVWCGVVWCGVVWCGVVWCGVVWCGVVGCGVVGCGLVWCGVVWFGVAWRGVVWCGVVWCGVMVVLIPPSDTARHREVGHVESVGVCARVLRAQSTVHRLQRLPRLGAHRLYHQTRHHFPHRRPQ